MPYPDLIQRVKQQYKNESLKGIDALFRFDYMGSSEFEFGTLPKTLRTMRGSDENPTLQKLVYQIPGGKQVVGYYVGLKSELKIAQDFWNDQLSIKPEWKLQERTYIKRAYDLDDQMRGDYQADTIGWWAVDIPKPWAIFKTEELAKTWMTQAYVDSWAEYVNKLKD